MPDQADVELAQARETSAALLSERVRIELDAEAQRYVQKTIDPQTNEVVHTFPAEQQLRFSRAISAYLRAQRTGPVNDL